MGPRESLLSHFNSFYVSVELEARPLHKIMFEIAGAKSEKVAVKEILGR